WYGTAILVLLSLKLLMSLLAAPTRTNQGGDEILARYKVAGIITCRNEDPAAVICHRGRRRFCLGGLREHCPHAGPCVPGCRGRLRGHRLPRESRETG